MKFSRMNNISLVKFSLDFIYNLKSPSNISFLWNFGSMLGICLVIQIVTGIFLSFHYSSNEYSFKIMNSLSRDVNEGIFFRFFHANGASIFFLFLYLHMFRGMKYLSFKLKNTWWIGSTIFLLSILTAFLGYVLPWGQMSFWAATVITNLVSAIPMIGQMVVEWLWGGYSVNIPTLNRFYSFHFLFPFILLFLVFLHLIYLHESYSNNPLGLKKQVDYIDFHHNFSKKDLMGLIFMFCLFTFISMFFPVIFMDAENFISSNPLKTPVHIKPEWYFLPFYAVLRSVPNKLGGVLLMVSVILYLYILPLNKKVETKIFDSILFFLFLLLFWLGGKAVLYPFDIISKILVFLFFMFILMKEFKKQIF